MRIIAGKYKSRFIKIPRGAMVRPTKDRIREALFSIIAPYISGASVLDLFAGSGAFGIEAISRGAKNVVFVDGDKRCVEMIKENIEALGVDTGIVSIFKIDAFKAIDKICSKDKKFDIVLLDPPYHQEAAKKCLIKLGERDILNPHCIISAEHHKKDILPASTGSITCFRVARYGDICLSFYRIK